MLVLFLQNSGSCINRLREKLSDVALYSSARNVSKVFQSISNVACLEVSEPRRWGTRMEGCLREKDAEMVEIAYAAEADVILIQMPAVVVTSHVSSRVKKKKQKKEVTAARTL